jgi:hypothetical protein
LGLTPTAISQGADPQFHDYTHFYMANSDHCLTNDAKGSFSFQRCNNKPSQAWKPQEGGGIMVSASPDPNTGIPPCVSAVTGMGEKLQLRYDAQGTTCLSGISVKDGYWIVEGFRGSNHLYCIGALHNASKSCQDRS